MRKMWVAGVAAWIALTMTTPVFAGTWIQDPAKPANDSGVSNWWYRNDDGTYPAGTWFWIDGNSDGIAESYCFNQNGWMYAAVPGVTLTVDGYEVNENGAWISGGQVMTKNVGRPDNSSSMKTDTPTSATDSDNTNNADTNPHSSDTGNANTNNRSVSAGSSLSDDEAYETIISLKGSYPEGMRWTNDNSHRSGNRIGYGCAGFAFMVQDSVFGVNAKKTQTTTLNWDELRVGDHLRVQNNMGGEHSVMILSVDDDSVTLCEGNFNSSIHWGRTMTRDELEDDFIYRETCY